MKQFLRLALRLALAAALVAVLAALPVERAQAAPSLQTSHSFLCAPEPVAGQSGPKLVVNTASTATPQPSYQLNTAGCALISAADVGFFLSQGFSYGPSVVNASVQGLTGAGTASVNTGITLPPYALVTAIITEETAGNAVTGGLNIGDAASAARYVAAGAVAANTNAVQTLAAQLQATTGIPPNNTILVAPATSWNSAVVNLTVVYTFY